MVMRWQDRYVSVHMRLMSVGERRGVMSRCQHANDRGMAVKADEYSFTRILRTHHGSGQPSRSRRHALLRRHFKNACGIRAGVVRKATLLAGNRQCLALIGRVRGPVFAQPKPNHPAVKGTGLMAHATAHRPPRLGAKGLQTSAKIRKSRFGT